MAVGRRRPEAEFEQTSGQLGRQLLTLGSLSGGFNDYTNPELLSPQFWAACANVYSGLFGTIRRARWAPVVNSSTSGGYTPNGLKVDSMFGYDSPTVTPQILFEQGTNRWSWFVNTGTAHPVPALFYAPTGNFAGPVMRNAMNGLIFETNGLIRAKEYFPSNVEPEMEFWGIDAPDTSPAITLSAAATATISSISRTNNVVTVIATAALPATLIVNSFVTISGVATATSFNSATGTAYQVTSVNGGANTFTFNQVGPAESDTTGTVSQSITKTVGRSYQWCWENAGTGHVSAPSPASQYVKYSAQIGTIDCLEVGTVTLTSASPIVNGVGTAFSQAWVGRSIWVDSVGGVTFRNIASVQSATQLTLSANAGVNASNKQFVIFDQQASHIRLYATGDGGAVFFRVARNVFDHTQSTIATVGVEFVDTANSEPPNAPFSSEIAPATNIPPPIGKFLQDYQGRILVYGVSGAPQSFFYSNIETTVVGQPPESFAPLNEVSLPIGDGQLNGMANLPTGLIIWSNRQDMFKVTGLLSDNSVANSQQLGATIQRLPYKIGCASPYATAVTPLGTIWLSSDREVWLFTDHYAPKNIGKSIQTTLNSINANLSNARMAYYKRGERNWLALAVSTGVSTVNNLLLLLDLDLLASNGQPSFFTFDMATNQPSWFQYVLECDAIATGFDPNSVSHLYVGAVDLITDVDFQTGFYTITAEQTVPSPSVTLHAFGNEAPQLIKTLEWIRTNTNQTTTNLFSQGWTFAVLCYDDDQYILGINPQTVSLTPNTQSYANIVPLEYSPAKFLFGGVTVAKGRRFQIQVNFPTTAGFYELRSIQAQMMNVVAR